MVNPSVKILTRPTSSVLFPALVLTLARGLFTAFAAAGASGAAACDAAAFAVTGLVAAT